ncbi:MAG: hypothetical protein ACREUR_05940 [Nitrosospira sp.]
MAAGLSTSRAGGSGSFTLAVNNIEGLATSWEARHQCWRKLVKREGETLMITDPDGNHIAFAEAIDPSIAK